MVFNRFYGGFFNVYFLYVYCHYFVLCFFFNGLNAPPEPEYFLGKMFAHVLYLPDLPVWVPTMGDASDVMFGVQVPTKKHHSLG